MRYKKQKLVSRDLVDRSLFDIIAFEKESMADEIAEELSEIIVDNFTDQSSNEENVVLSVDFLIIDIKNLAEFEKSIKEQLPESAQNVASFVLKQLLSFS